VTYSVEVGQRYVVLKPARAPWSIISMWETSKISHATHRSRTLFHITKADVIPLQPLAGSRTRIGNMMTSGPRSFDIIRGTKWLGADSGVPRPRWHEQRPPEVLK